MWFIVIIQINSKVALCGGVKEITGKWEYSLGFWQLYTNCPQQKNLMKSPDERLFRQEVAEDWRVSFSSDEEEASWFHFLFSFCFDILASCLRIQQYSFLWRPPLRSFSPPHHTLLIIIIVVGYRVWQTSKGRLWSLERLASRGHHGGPRRTLHSTEQLSSVSGGAENGSEPGDCRWHCWCSPQSSSLHSWLGTGGWRWHLYAWSGFDLSARFVFIFTVM